MKTTFASLYIIAISFFILNSSNTFAQSNSDTDTLITIASNSADDSAYEEKSPEMATRLRSSGMIWVVVGVILIILFGLIFYLNIIERKIKTLENEIHNNKQ